MDKLPNANAFEFFENVAQIIEQARKYVGRTADITMCKNPIQQALLAELKDADGSGKRQALLGETVSSEKSKKAQALLTIFAESEKVKQCLPLFYIDELE